MKRNKSGLYEMTDGEFYIRDIETNQYMFFLLDSENRLVIRSMLEDDIKSAINTLDITSREKRKRQSILWNAIPLKGAESFFFVVEKIVTIDSESIYEEDRIVIGFGIRNTTGINIYLNKSHSKCKENVLSMVEKMAKFFEPKGEAAHCIPAK